MATILFYEKPGCINNTRQKALLQAAGHQILAHSLLTEAWTFDRLQQFFGQRPVADWFNRSAPQVKSGEVIPEQLDPQTALQLMIKHPLLIRRPLMQVGDRCEVGFELDQIEAWIGLTSSGDLAIEQNSSETPQQESFNHDLSQIDLQTCPRSLNHHLSSNCSARSPVLGE